MTGDPCFVDGCDVPVLAKDLCGAHYAQLRRHGPASLRHGDPDRPEPTLRCAVAGCEAQARVRAASDRDYCDPHYWRVRAHGDPYGHVPIGSARTLAPERPNFVNPWQWSGEAPPCPACREAGRVYLWAPEVERPWYCSRCDRRFAESPEKESAQ